MESVKIKGRLFYYNDNNKTYYLPRETDINIWDITGSASLAMHKAIIGVTELASLEKAEKLISTNFRRAKAVQTYYIIYHLFTCCMLLDDKYEICFRVDDKNTNLEYGVELSTLRKKPKWAWHWNKRGKYEQDLATRITHSSIKRYCGDKKTGLRERVRIEEKLPSYLKSLFDSFVDENNSILLFEKADYIRDRAIYRPSWVAQEGGQIQTSKYIKKQIDSLPNAIFLYALIKEIHLNICKEIKVGDFRLEYVYNFVHAKVDCSEKYASSLGYSWDVLEKLGGVKRFKEVPPYICQMMELYDEKDTVLFYDQYWKDLLNESGNFLELAYKATNNN